MIVVRRLSVVVAMALTLTGLGVAPVAATAAATPAGNSTSITVSPAAPVTSNPTPVYRFYKLTDGSHFFTNNENEKTVVLRSPGIYRYEGVAFYSYPTQVAGSTAVYRFYNFTQGVHFYTSNEQEFRTVRDTAASTFRYEGIAYYSLPSETTASTPVQRFYKFRQGVHFYTSNQAEANALKNTASATYRYEGVSYYLPNQLTFSGSGTSVSESFVLPSTLAVFRSVYTGADSNFIVWLTEQNTGEIYDLVANSVGASSDTSVPVGVDENRYLLEVQSAGDWTITIDQPKSSVGFLTDFGGMGTSATQLFSLLKGGKTVSYSHDGSSNFIVWLYDGEGFIVDLIANEIGTAEGGTVVSVPTSGNYMIGVQADGNWALSIR